MTTSDFLLERYGVRLDIDQLAQVLNVSQHTLRNQLSAGHLPLKTYRVRGRRFADYRDVAEYLDRCRETAA